MPGHTNNAALNEAARLELARLRKDADEACTDYTAVYLSGFAEGKAEQKARITELERKLADALQSVQSWQMEVAGRDADIARLERELDEARAHAKWAEEDGKKWKKRAECIARWYCTKASCIECRHKSKCRFHTHPPALLFATADKE